MLGANQVFKDRSSAFFIVDIKFNKFNNTVCSVDYFYNSALANFITDNMNILVNIFHQK